jgi:hypothetical protein
MGAARLQWQVLKLHVCARCCPAAARRQFLKLHTSDLQSLAWQWPDTKLHALLQWQVLKLLKLSKGRANMQQQQQQQQQSSRG